MTIRTTQTQSRLNAMFLYRTIRDTSIIALLLVSSVVCFAQSPSKFIKCTATYLKDDQASKWRSSYVISMARIASDSIEIISYFPWASPKINPLLNVRIGSDPVEHVLDQGKTGVPSGYVYEGWRLNYEEPKACKVYSQTPLLDNNTAIIHVVSSDKHGYFKLVGFLKNTK